MPTPLQLLLDPISLTVFAIFGALLLLAALFPARILPRVRFWRLAGLTSSEEHTSELQSLMRISYAVFCWQKKKKQHYYHTTSDRYNMTQYNKENTID